MSTLKVTSIQATGETASRAVSGVAGAWANIDGTGTVGINNSSNASSVTDSAVGNYLLNLTNAYADSTFCCSADGNFAATSGYSYHVSFPNSASQIRCNCAKDGAGEQDVDPFEVMTVGDLA